jgi:phage terminase large subunit-like protein
MGCAGAIPDARRQGCQSAVYSRQDGAGRALRPVNAPWYPELRSELLSFPAGKHDDQVDALGLVGQLLDKMMHPAKAERA